MQIAKTFVVRADPEAVWTFLTDPHRVAKCLPDASITGQVDEHTYEGAITVKVGPVATSYKGTVKFERLDRGARTAEFVATGQDVRGKGGAEMHITSRLVQQGPGETEVTLVSDVSVTGILAQMGRGMIQDISDQIFQRFTAAMSAELQSAGPARTAPQAGGVAAKAEGIQVVSLGAGALGRAGVRALRHPGVWVALVLIAAVVIWLVVK